MTPEKIHDALNAAHPGAVLAFDPNPKLPSVKIAAGSWKVRGEDAAATRAGWTTSCASRRSTAGAELEAIYTLENIGETRTPIHVRRSFPAKTPCLPTVEDVWRTAASARTRSLGSRSGIVFEGHHNLAAHPLRRGLGRAPAPQGLQVPGAPTTGSRTT
jgi:hypothetical protein